MNQSMVSHYSYVEFLICARNTYLLLRIESTNVVLSLIENLGHAESHNRSRNEAL